MKLLLPCIALCGVLAAQTPTQEPKPAPAPAPKVEPAKQDPAKQDPAKKDPAKQDPAKQEPKAGDKPVTDKPATEEPKIDRPAADQPIPKGTDPADLAAMRSAEQMLQAEKRLADEIKAGKIAGLDKILPFDELDSWPYEDGLKGMPKRVKELDGKKVLMTGFMLPIDEVQNIKEFLLVKSLWSCCYGTPPDLHEIVRCVLPAGQTTDYTFEPVLLTGTLTVGPTVEDGYVVDVFQLQVSTITPLPY